MWGTGVYLGVRRANNNKVATLALGSQFEDREDRRLPAALTGFCFGLLTWIKNEGLVLALLLGMAYGIMLLARRGLNRATVLKDLGRLLWIGVGAAPVLLALGLFKVYWSPINETGRFLEGALGKMLDPERWSTVARAFFHQLNPWTGAADWGLLWAFAALIGVLTWRNRWRLGRPLVFLELVVLLAWVAWFTVYLCTPATLEWHLGSSLKRLMLQLAPLTLYWALAGAGRPRDGAA